MRYLKQLDQFSVHYQSYIHKGENEHKSTFGAISSLIIYILAILYIIQQIYQWQNNQFLPTIVQTTQISHQLNINQNEIEIDFDPYKKLSFDVFDVNSMVFLPNLTAYCNNDECTQLLQNQQFEQIMKNNTYIIKNLNFSNQLSSNIINDYFIQFYSCRDDIYNLNHSIKCASNILIKEYFKKFNLIQIKLGFQQYDVLSNSIQSFKKSFWLDINNTKSFYTQINLMAGLTSVDEGIILPTQTDHNFIASSEINTKEVYGEPFTFAVDLYLDELYQFQQIQYPLLGSVLANAGSIVSLIFWLSYLVQKFNQISLEKFLVNEIIGFYYPELKQITIKRKWYDKKDVKFYSKDGKKEYEPEKLIKIYQNASKIAIEKLSIINIVYELSRIQFILQSLQDRNYFQQSREIGIQLPLEVMQNQRLKIIPVQRMNGFQSKNPKEEVQDSQEIINQSSDLLNIQNFNQDLITQKFKNNLLQQDQSQSNTLYNQILFLRFAEINMDINLRKNDTDPQFINDSDVIMIQNEIGFLIKIFMIVMLKYKYQVNTLNKVEGQYPLEQKIDKFDHYKLQDSDIMLLTYYSTKQHQQQKEYKNHDYKKFYQINNMAQNQQLIS